MERGVLRIIVDLNFGKEGNLFGIQAKGDVTGAVAGASFDTLPILDLGHDDVDDFAQEMIHGLAAQITGDGDVLTLSNAKASDALGSSVCSGTDIGDGLQSHACNMQVCAVLDGALDHAVYGNTLQLGDIAECDGLAQEWKYIASSWATQGSVLEVWRISYPLTQTRAFLGWLVAWREMMISERHQIDRKSVV